MTINNSRINEQKETIKVMIYYYCKRKHGNNNSLCYKCSDLLKYATMRIDKCRYGEKKPNCSECKIHCYKIHMRESIIEVMKFSAPRMLIYNPKIVIKHLISRFRYS